MVKRIDYKFGDRLHKDTRWTFLYYTESHYKMPSGKPERKGAFICECGNLADLQLRHVRSGQSKSCGCLQKEYYDSQTLHGLYNHDLFPVWTDMMQRCYNENRKSYKNYGGRGIKVCERWRGKLEGPVNFIEDMGERPEGYTLDRINTNGNYEPANCRWATASEQGYNRRVRKDNSSGVAGVNWDTHLNKWKVTLAKKPNKYYLGVYDDFEEAVKVRREAEIEYWGYNLSYSEKE